MARGFKFVFSGSLGFSLLIFIGGNHPQNCCIIFGDWFGLWMVSVGSECAVGVELDVRGKCSF